MLEIQLKDNYNHNLHTYIFNDCKETLGVVQIIHGINEHGLRYVEFAEFLNQHGYVVYVHDHVSQGKSRLDNEEFVHFGKHGNKVLIDGLNTVRNKIKEDYPNLPIYLFGHSLGTMIIRKYLQTEKNDYTKVIMNGGGYADINYLWAALFLAKFLKVFVGKRPSNIFDNMFRGTQLKLQQKVDMDHFIEWLTRDLEKTKINMEDPYLFIRLTISTYTDMLEDINYINKYRHIAKNSLDVPVLLLSGTHDAATDFGNDVIALNDAYKSLDIDTRYILYPEGRHDSLQEINRQDVFKDILDFIGG